MVPDSSVDAVALPPGGSDFVWVVRLVSASWGSPLRFHPLVEAAYLLTIAKIENDLCPPTEGRTGRMVSCTQGNIIQPQKRKPVTPDMNETQGHHVS